MKQNKGHQIGESCYQTYRRNDQHFKMEWFITLLLLLLLLNFLGETAVGIM